MCGIAGIASPKPIDERILPAYVEALRHRGPDDEGIYVNPQRTVGLAHTRLSILDLSAAGHQPMANEDETLWITYNGEIYNFQELREELLRKGHRFRSQTDTEVLLHLYEETGEEVVQRLVGMFAFALYDQKNNRLFLARDRLGIKPLYYTDHAGMFLFASEIKALLSTQHVPVSVNWQAIWDYFTFAFVPHPDTAFEGILQLPPAHTLTINLATRRSSLRRYWTPWGHASKNEDHSYEALRSQVRETLRTAVRSELVSDVPLGLFFSGGIDSTLLAALMGRHSGKKVQSFTVVFPELENLDRSDLAYARLASKTLGTEHHELPVRLEEPRGFLEMIRYMDQPFGNATLYLQHLIAKATRQHVTVALSGVGGDELFGGYPKYQLLPLAPFLRLIPNSVGRVARQTLALFHEDLWSPILRRTKRALRGAGVPLAEQYTRWAYSFDEIEKTRLLSGFRQHGRIPESSVRIVEKILAKVPSQIDRYGKIFSAELETFLADNLLAYTDAATMAVALETRVPFLDHRLVELAARIPFHDKLRRGRPKHILIDAFRDLLPEPIAKAPKRGFSPPLAAWMNRVLDRYFDEILLPQQRKGNGPFSWEAIQTLRVAHRRGRTDASSELLSILMFDIWYRHYILKQSNWS